MIDDVRHICNAVMENNSVLWRLLGSFFDEFYRNDSYPPSSLHFKYQDFTAEWRGGTNQVEAIASSEISFQDYSVGIATFSKSQADMIIMRFWS